MLMNIMVLFIATVHFSNVSRLKKHTSKAYNARQLYMRNGFSIFH
jgi:hypothetical protein